MKMPNTRPALSLDDLATAKLKRRITDLKAMPGLNNSIGSVQMEADPVAIKHPVFPPFSASGETTAITFLGNKHIAQVCDWIDVRWKAYAVERECTAGTWYLSSVTSLHPTQPVVVVRGDRAIPEPPGMLGQYQRFLPRFPASIKPKDLAKPSVTQGCPEHACLQMIGETGIGCNHSILRLPHMNVAGLPVSTGKSNLERH